jgi:SlyX protein
MTTPTADEGAADRARIDELEARVAHQDQSLLELGDELYRQQRQIAQLEDRLRELVERFKSMAAGAEPAVRPEDEKPPHY